MTRRVLTIAMSAALLLAAVVAAAPARADDEIGLSPDGTVWYDALRRPLFDPAFRWVPGDADTASFYVRNGSPTAAELTIEVRGADGADLLADDDVEITARAAGGQWFALENGTPSPWLTNRAIDQGGQVRVDVRVRFLWQAPNSTMLDRLPLDFEVRLVGAGASDGDTGSDGPNGLLPDTGSLVSRVVIWLAAILIGCGLALLAARRRRPELEPAEADEVSVADEGVRVDG